MAGIATRQAFGEALAETGDVDRVAALAELGEKHPHIVALDADLSKSTKTQDFAKRFPDRFFDFGIAEANMIGAAAGLAFSGKKPFCASFACFITGRFDQIRLSIGYSRANVVVVGTHAGVAIGQDGHSQMGLEDLACMRSVSGMAVIQPGDQHETRQAVEYLVGHEGPAYLRLTRQTMTDISEEADCKFVFGKGVKLREGKDLTIFASGGPLYNALLAAEELAQDGVEARVVNIHTLKPIDRELIQDSAKKTGRFVTVEDHNIIGGLGSAVCETAAESQPVPTLRLGLNEEFGESGDPKALYEKFGLSPAGIAKAIRKWLN